MNMINLGIAKMILQNQDSNQQLHVLSVMQLTCLYIK